MNTENLKQEAKQLHQQGNSYKQIAEKLELSKSAAFRLINENNSSETFHETFQKTVPVQFQQEVHKDDNNNNYEIRKLELEHEQEILRLKMEEKERERTFELEKLQQGNNQLQNQLDQIQEQLENNNTEEEYYEEEIEPEDLPEELMEEYTDIINHLLESNENQKSWDINDANETILKIKQLQINMLNWNNNNNSSQEAQEQLEFLTEIEEMMGLFKEKINNQWLFGSRFLSLHDDFTERLENAVG